jgi:hypothetical protein
MSGNHTDAFRKVKFDQTSIPPKNRHHITDALQNNIVEDSQTHAPLDMLEKTEHIPRQIFKTKPTKSPVSSGVGTQLSNKSSTIPSGYLTPVVREKTNEFESDKTTERKSLGCFNELMLSITLYI